MHLRRYRRVRAATNAPAGILLGGANDELHRWQLLGDLLRNPTRRSRRFLHHTVSAGWRLLTRFWGASTCFDAPLFGLLYQPSLVPLSVEGGDLPFTPPMSSSNSSSDGMSRIATFIIAVCAVVMTGLAVKDRLVEPARKSRATPMVIDQADWADFDVGGNVIGDATAPIKVVIFSDYECPYCKLMAERLRDVQSKYPSQVAVRHRHWPLTAIHQRAYRYAVAAECAAKQVPFESASSALFALGSLPFDSTRSLSNVVGVRDSTTFLACLTDSLMLRRVDADASAARRLNAGGTPVTLIGRFRVNGAVPLPLLDSLVQVQRQASNR